MIRFLPPPQGTHPPNACDAYQSSRRRAPKRPPVPLAHTRGERTSPAGRALLGSPVTDLTRDGSGEAIGERIVVSGRVLDEDGRPLRGALIEIWQANAAGRYAHEGDAHAAPLDPHFRGLGRLLTDADGGYRFLSIKPGAYPWRNHPNAWRPAHIHLSLFGRGFASRLVTQMYFPGDPLLPLDPIYGSVPDPAARDRLICRFDIETTVPEHALGYRFDVVLRGRESTPAEHGQ
ncbi:MAG TPA: protocatechuate 3,4-dioxygenase subunit beta [Gemmatimonadales bacterium]|nr:protocatechuate 3,4-dioxygenase subunit beta [Gemmatimonadales bacterium]